MGTHSRKTPLDPSIGLRIRAFRLARQWSQEDLAKRIRLTGAAVSHWESGRIEPRPQHLRTLAHTFGIRGEVLSGDYLMGDSEEARTARKLEALLLRLLAGSSDGLHEALERFDSPQELLAWLEKYEQRPKDKPTTTPPRRRPRRR